MKILKLTDEEYYFLKPALLHLRRIMEAAHTLNHCIQAPDTHYSQPLGRIIDKLSDIQKREL